MSLIKREGTFRFNVTEHGIGQTRESKYPQLILALQAYEYWDEQEQEWVDWAGVEENEITAYLVLFGGGDKPIFHIDACEKAFGWDGVNFSSLNECIVDGETCIQAVVAENIYNDIVSLQVSRIDHVDATPGRTLQKLEVSEIKDLDKQFALPLKKRAGIKPVKPKGAPTVPVVKPKSKPEPEPEQKTEVKPPKKDKKTKAAPPKQIKGCTQEDAWEACMKAKDASVTDDKLGEIWLQAVATIAPDGDEDNMTPELWQQVKEVVITQVKDDVPF